MRTHTRTRTQYGLDGDNDQHWSANAACRDDPDAFTAPDQTGRWSPMAGLHTCRYHCPVRIECHAYAHTQEPNRRAGMILGGVAYNSRGDIAEWNGANTAASTCVRCVTVRQPQSRQELKPADTPLRAKHGSVIAARWHRDHGVPLCSECYRGEYRRKQDRLAKRAKRDRMREAEGAAWTS